MLFAPVHEIRRREPTKLPSSQAPLDDQSIRLRSNARRPLWVEACRPSFALHISKSVTAASDQAMACFPYSPMATPAATNRSLTSIGPSRPPILRIPRGFGRLILCLSVIGAAQSVHAL